MNDGLLLIRYDHLHERDWRNDDSYKLIFSQFGEAQYLFRQSDVRIGQDEFIILNAKC